MIGPDRVCDSHHKIVEPSRPDRTVLVVVGGGMQIAAPPPDVVDPCAYLRQAPRFIDINAVAKDYLETSGDIVASMQTDRLAALCMDAVASFQRTLGDEIRNFWGQRMFAVLLAGYDPAGRKSTVTNFSIHLGVNGEPFVSEKETHTMDYAGRGTMLAFGEAAFLLRKVMDGPGKQFLGSRYGELRKKTRIADIDRSVAVNAAVDLIEAASKTVDLPRHAVPIGGAVDAVLLGNQSRPQRLRWQAP
jgi:hypothetical protein